MSGLKSKIHNISNILSQEHFHICAIQETWLNHTVSDLEIIGGTNYAIIRNDRCHFLSNRVNGGGVMILIYNSVKDTEIQIEIKTIVEIQIVEIILPLKSIIFINVYFAPNRARAKQTKEFNTIANQVRLDFPKHIIIIVGDMNLPNINWAFDENNTHLRITNEHQLTPNERRFHSICQNYGLQQYNHTQNSRGITLDWILSTETISNISHVPAHLSLDLDSVYHKALSFQFEYFQTEEI